MKRTLAILERVGFNLGHHTTILDFGCGAGQTVYSLRDLGYHNTIGYDVKDYLKLRDPADRRHFVIAASNGHCLPFLDNTFDLIISQQVFEHVMDPVPVFRELYRIMRPGAVALHVFPARYSFIEPHMHVPLGSVLGHRLWFRMWALLGVRNEFQKGLGAGETADRNAFYFAEGLNYVPNSCLEVVWRRLAYDYRWIDQEICDTSEKAFMRVLGRVNRVVPIVGWLLRTFRQRAVYLTKCAASPVAVVTQGGAQPPPSTELRP